ncbi:hypothetical protein V6Z11_A10G276300 [Gossypium hirsutum]
MEELWNEDDNMEPSTLNSFIALTVKGCFNYGTKIIIGTLLI